MDLTLNRDVMNVELSGIRQFTYLVRDTPGACALTIGEPDLNTPDAIKEAATIHPATATPTPWRPSPSSRQRPMVFTTPPARSS